MTVRRATFRWPAQPPGSAPRDPQARRGLPLAERLALDVDDRCRPAAELVASAAREAWAWTGERPQDWAFEPAAAELEAGFAAWSAAHAWRGPAALFLDTLRGAFRRARERGERSPRAALLEELAQWVVGPDEPAEELEWDGQPLSPGRRLPRRQDVARAAAAALAPRELVAVAGCSETVALALAEGRRRGLEPRACVPVGGPDQAGLRMARRLVELGLAVRVCPDAAFAGELGRVDRLWLGSEAIGAGCFAAPIGLTRLLEEARRRELAVEGLATSDKLVPGGAVELPRRDEEEAWLLWSEAPAGVELEARLWERAPLELVERWWTERGGERARELCLRALRSEAAAPLDAPVEPAAR